MNNIPSEPGLYFVKTRANKKFNGIMRLVRKGECLVMDSSMVFGFHESYMELHEITHYKRIYTPEEEHILKSLGKLSIKRS